MRDINPPIWRRIQWEDATLEQLHPVVQNAMGGEASTRRIGGIAPLANGMDEPDRINVTDAIDGFLAGKRYLIHDRDPLYTRGFLSTWLPVESSRSDCPHVRPI